MEDKERKCKLCDKTFSIIDKGWTRLYCYECSPSFANNNGITHAQNVTTKRRAIKTHLINRAGGKCTRCGYNKSIAALQFHHLNPKEKDFGIARDFSNNLEKLYKEVEKCVLLCANCHAELHSEEHGELA